MGMLGVTQLLVDLRVWVLRVLTSHSCGFSLHDKSSWESCGHSSQPLDWWFWNKYPSVKKSLYFEGLNKSPDGSCLELTESQPTDVFFRLKLWNRVPIFSFFPSPESTKKLVCVPGFLLGLNLRLVQGQRQSSAYYGFFLRFSSCNDLGISHPNYFIVH